MSTIFQRPFVLAAAALLAVGGLYACASYHMPKGHGRAAGVAALSRNLSDAGLTRYVSDMDPAMLTLAQRHDPRPHQDYWGRVRGWERLRLDLIPKLGDTAPSFEDARLINGFRDPAPLPMEAARPFILTGASSERGKALHCLTQAVYFEAAYEPLEGQEAVAQTVLNRVRHPGYPKSVCGVIYEGSARSTGCQFSFACDGSLERALNPVIWARAGAVARRALNGFVMKEVGTATHYHADYVAPYWAPTLVKLKQLGVHIFYRWTGPSGTLAAFNGRYSGRETVTADILMSADSRTLEAAPPEVKALENRPRAPTIVGEDGAVEILPSITPAAGVVDADGRVHATIGGRRAPTPEDIAKINKSLEALPEVAAAPAPTPAPLVSAPPKPKPQPAQSNPQN